jgi:hypothetical protein
MNDDTNKRWWTNINGWKGLNVDKHQTEVDEHQTKLRRTLDETTTDIRRNHEECLTRLGLALHETTRKVGRNCKERWTKL